MASKRVVFVSDFHSGHLVGLTPPKFDATYEEGTKQAELATIRRNCWDFYKSTLDSLKPIDVLVVNGDAIDGKGARTGGTELLTSDRNYQVDIAVGAIREADAGIVFMSYGTPYHAGDLEDWEDAIAREVKAAKIGSQDWLDVNGLVFNYRHFVSGSSIPHGRYTPLARERLWGLLWAEFDEYPKAQVIVRSHVHYFSTCGGYGWTGFTTPALQGYGSKFGTRKISGTVDFGLLSFTVESREVWGWQAHIMKSKSQGDILKA